MKSPPPGVGADHKSHGRGEGGGWSSHFYLVIWCVKSNSSIVARYGLGIEKSDRMRDAKRI